MLGSTQAHSSGTIWVSLYSDVNRIGPETELFVIGKCVCLVWLPKFSSIVCLLEKMADSQYRVGRGIERKSFQYNRFPENTHAYVWCQEEKNRLNKLLHFYTEIETTQGHINVHVFVTLYVRDRKWNTK